MVLAEIRWKRFGVSTNAWFQVLEPLLVVRGRFLTANGVDRDVLLEMTWSF
jgi:hypothetical protein